MKKKLFLSVGISISLITSVFGQVSIGSGAGTLGTQFVYVGDNSGRVATGGCNSFLGYNSGYSNTIGGDNSGFGFNALYSNTNGYQNSAFGKWAMANNTGGYANSAFGMWALTSNTTGYNNAAVGNSALSQNNGGYRNTAVGIQSLYSNSSGNTNSGFGFNALYDNMTGSNNTAIGYNTGRGITTGSNNTIIGSNVTGLSSSTANNIIIADGSGNRRINVDNTGEVGIGTNTPSAKLHINSGIAGISGLRLEQLTSSSSPALSSGIGLSVDASGNVILEENNYWSNDGAASGFSTYHSNTFNNVAIGWIPTALGAGAKLDVYSTFPKGIRSETVSTGGNPVAVQGWAEYDGDGGYLGGWGGEFHGGKMGVRGEYSNFTNHHQPVGEKMGVFGLAANNRTDGTQISRMYGVYGSGYNDNVSFGYAFGVYGKVSGNPFAQYAVYGDASYFTGSAVYNYAGYFDGDVYTTGSYLPSDAKLKTNIKPMESTLSKIMQLKPSTYKYDTEKYKSMSLPNGERSGFIAQELEMVFPTLTKKSLEPQKTNEKGNVIAEEVEFTAVNYVELIPILTKAIQEQQQMIDELTKKVALSTEINKTGGTIQGTSSQKVDINKTAVLFQNHPNPLDGVTFIEYYLPQSSANAFIRITDNNGKLVQAFPLNSTGYGQVELNCANMAQGTYHYSLLVDSKIVETKTMVVAARN